MARKVRNDQGPLLKKLKQRKYYEAWEVVKYIGVQDIPDPNQRFLIFQKAANEFNPDMSDNFILLYKRNLKWCRAENGIHFTSRTNYKRLLNEKAAPTGELTPLLKGLMDVNW